MKLSKLMLALVLWLVATAAEARHAPIVVRPIAPRCPPPVVLVPAVDVYGRPVLVQQPLAVARPVVVTRPVYVSRGYRRGWRGDRRSWRGDRWWR